MSELLMEHINDSMNFIISRLQNDKDIIETTILPKFNKLKEDVDLSKIGFSLGKFINAEMDFTTPGNRGLGRTTEYVPRFGGYYRKRLSNLSSVDLIKLEDSMRNVMLCGYLACVLIEKPMDISIKDSLDLYQKWIPRIYVFDPEAHLEQTRLDIFHGCTQYSIQIMMDFMKSKNIKAGGLFAKDKGYYILLDYVVAGFVLRLTEILG